MAKNSQKIIFEMSKIFNFSYFRRKPNKIVQKEEDKENICIVLSNYMFLQLLLGMPSFQQQNIVTEWQK